MPVLKKPENKTLYLPSTINAENEADKGYVVIRERLLLSDASDINSTEDSIAKAFILAEKLITEWNFTDENGTPLPISRDTIELLSEDDQTAIFNKIGDISNKSFQGVTKDENLDSGASSPEAEIPTISPQTT